MIKALFFFVLALFSDFLCAQDSQFTMPYSSGTNLNPALAGAIRSPRIYFNYTNGNPGISGTNVTTSLCYDRYIPALSGGLGLQYINNWWSQAALHQLRVSGIYSRRVLVTRELVVCPAIEASYAENRLDWQLLNTSPGGGVYTQNKQVVSFPDFSSGIFAYTRRWNLGLSFFHVTQPEEGFGTGSLPMRFVAHGSTDLMCYDTVRTIIVAPSFLFVTQQDYKMLQIGLALQYGQLAIGLAGSNKDQLVGSLGFRSGRIKMGYSYDIFISNTGIVTAGSHEINFSYAFRVRGKRTCFRSTWFSTASF